MRRVLAVVALLSIVLVGCGDDADDDTAGADGGDTTTTAAETTEPSADAVEPAAFDVTSVDFGYEFASAEVPAGPVQVSQTNEGSVDHQVTLIRLDDGMTPDELVTIVAEEGDDALDPSIFAGGPNSVRPGESNTALVELTAGDYVAYCFLPNHAAQGMVEPFSVTGEPPVEVATPTPASTVGLSNFEFAVPEGFDGQGTVEVVNDGDQAHELTIITADQASAGGLTTIAPGETGYVDLALPPGDYRFVCFITDPDSGQIHLQLGMDQPVTIS